MDNTPENIKEKPQKNIKLSRLKLSPNEFKSITAQVLDTVNVDSYTKKMIKKQLIDMGKSGYIILIRKHNSFLTPIRLMVLTDFADIYKSFRYYLNKQGTFRYDKNISKDYNLISGLQAAELKLIMLEQLYEIFGDNAKLSVISHSLQKIDVEAEVSEVLKLDLSDNTGTEYTITLNPGIYAFESRSCCSISNSHYILSNEKRINLTKKYERYFLFVPKDTVINEKAWKDLEKNNIKIMFSDYGTIDIVNDVAYMEGFLDREVTI